MSRIPNGGSNEISPVNELTQGDVWENQIRMYGVINACEWFGYDADSDFTKETIRVLMTRSSERQERKP